MKAKIITIMILVVLFTIFVSQNTSVVKISAFFWTFEMSAIVLISLIGLVGVILGFILASIFNKKKKPDKIDKKKKEKENKGSAIQNKNV
jgi:uncharacterized integral membrane protein